MWNVRYVDFNFLNVKVLFDLYTASGGVWLCGGVWMYCGGTARFCGDMLVVIWSRSSRDGAAVCCSGGDSASVVPY